MTSATLPQARIALGSATVQGQRVPVYIDVEWMRALEVLLQVINAAGGADALTELIGTLAQAPAGNPQTQEALRGIDELRIEMPTRGDLQSLRSRVELIEDRLA